jgi:hypothetical protein
VDGSRSDTREHVGGQADLDDELRARVSSWRPVRPTRLRRERGSVVVVWPNQCHEDSQLAIRSVDKTAALAVPGALAVLAGADYVANGLKPIPGRRALAELNKAIKNIDQHPTRLIFGR